MGNSQNKVRCEECYRYWGELGVLEISHGGNLGGHTICVRCYPHLDKEKYEGYKFISKQCELCNYKNDKHIDSRAIFKIYWHGKFGGRTMCEKCLYNKKYRRRHAKRKE
jgi:hypothetical protein